MLKKVFALSMLALTLAGGIALGTRAIALDGGDPIPKCSPPHCPAMPH